MPVLEGGRGRAGASRYALTGWLEEPGRFNALARAGRHPGGGEGHTQCIASALRSNVFPHRQCWVRERQPRSMDHGWRR
jgi:hypothetical protein